MSNELARARLSLEGLSLGDAFGERFFVHPAHVDSLIDARAMPSARVWHWTDDTAMALSVVAELQGHGTIDETSLAMRLALAYRRDPHRGYGPAAHNILTEIGQGVPWREASGRPGCRAAAASGRAPAAATRRRRCVLRREERLELRQRSVEVVGHADRPSQSPELPRGLVALDRNQPHAWTPRLRDHDVLARLGRIDEAAQVGLGLLDVDRAHPASLVWSGLVRNVVAPPPATCTLPE